MSAPHRHRFHLDQEGHSITVLLGRAAHDVEVLVDGKVVAVRHERGRRGVRELAAELPGEPPGDPPRPFTVLVEDVDGTPLCVMVRDGIRYLMPRVPLLPEAPPYGAPGATHPLRRARGRARRWVRRLLRPVRRWVRRALRRRLGR
ncbi:hypothetical protein AB0A69_23775 [Streptomyces sp. NPDC045431]|uniref:hypothetical protein n=1 Tax=Streptomyces sp. NPDC045431 TaxID=3155613 RepID=UPI0034103C43